MLIEIINKAKEKMNIYAFSERVNILWESLSAGQSFSYEEQQATGMKKSSGGVACCKWDAVMERDQSTGIFQPPRIRTEQKEGPASS